MACGSDCKCDDCGGDCHGSRSAVKGPPNPMNPLLPGDWVAEAVFGKRSASSYCPSKPRSGVNGASEAGSSTRTSGHGVAGDRREGPVQHAMRVNVGGVGPLIDPNADGGKGIRIGGGRAHHGGEGIFGEAFEEPVVFARRRVLEGGEGQLVVFGGVGQTGRREDAPEGAPPAIGQAPMSHCRCGPDVGVWFLEEIRRHYQFWVRAYAWAFANSIDSRSYSIMFANYARWIPYRGMNFSTGVCPNPLCTNCRRTVWICTYCISRTELGNIMFGVAARVAGFPFNITLSIARNFAHLDSVEDLAGLLAGNRIGLELTQRGGWNNFTLEEMCDLMDARVAQDILDAPRSAETQQLFQIFHRFTPGQVMRTAWPCVWCPQSYVNVNSNMAALPLPWGILFPFNAVYGQMGVRQSDVGPLD